MKLYNTRSNIKILTLIKLCAQYSPASFIICIALTIIEGLMIPFMLYTVARFIDSAVTITSPNPDTKTMFIYLGLTALGFLYSQLGQDFRQYGYDRLEDALRNGLKPDIIMKEYSIDFLVFEAAATQDLIFRVTEEIEAKFTGVIRSVNTAVSVFIQVFGVLYAVAVYNWWIALLYIAIMISSILLTFRNGKVIYQEEKKVEFLTRQMNYISDLLSNRETVHERSLFGFSGELNHRFMSAHLYRSNFNTKLLARETSGSMMLNIVISIFTVFTIYVLSRQIANGILSVGLFTSITGSMINLSKIVSLQSSELVLEFSRHTEYAKDFEEFIQLKETRPEGMNGGSKISFESLEIRNLRFQYKDSKEYILMGINISLKKGRSYSLVGLNGAGKSTLVKILVGLYREYEGEIILNGKDLKLYDSADLRCIFSVVSQDFAKYYIMFKDNITLGGPEGSIDKVMSQLELQDLLHNLPMKEHSYLGKVYDGGIDVSGGEWQRIAIARALYQDSAFMIMDEPTAALSPTAESAMYSRFMQLAKDKTLLMISHRLGSTKIADEIIVLDQGKILEKGAHEELMQDGSVYAQLFRKQSEMYDKA